MLLILIKNKQVGILVIINLILNSLLNLALKNIFTRGRPTITHLIKENGYSLPSGHAMASLAFYGLIIYLVYKSVNLSKKVKTILISLLTLLIILIGISRIYLGVHYVSDVIAGYSITTFYLIIYTEIIKNNLRGRSNEKKQVSK